ADLLLQLVPHQLQGAARLDAGADVALGDDHAGVAGDRVAAATGVEPVPPDAVAGENLEVVLDPALRQAPGDDAVAFRAVDEAALPGPRLVVGAAGAAVGMHRRRILGEDAPVGRDGG